MLFAIINSPFDGIAKIGRKMIKFLFHLAILLVTSRQSQSPVKIDELTMSQQINVDASAVNPAQGIGPC